MFETPLTFVLTLALISRLHPTVKEKKKQLIKLSKRATGSAALVLNHILRDNHIDRNIADVVSDQVQTLEMIAIASAGGAQGLVTIGYNYHPVFIDVASVEDKVLALESESAIIQTALESARKMGYPKGTTAVSMLFIADGYTGIPVSTRL